MHEQLDNHETGVPIERVSGAINYGRLVLSSVVLVGSAEVAAPGWLGLAAGAMGTVAVFSATISDACKVARGGESCNPFVRDPKDR